MKKGRVIVTMVCFFVLFSGLYSHGADVRGVTGDTIKIGYIAAMTGVAAYAGKPYAEAVRNYFHHINDQGGIHGRKVKVYVEDSQYKIPMAISAFKKLVTLDKVLATCTFGTPEVTALLPYHKKEKIVTIPLSQSSTFISPVQKYVFMPTASYKEQMYVLIDYIKDTLKADAARLAIVYADNEFGRSGLRDGRDRAKRNGFKIVDEEPVKWGAVDYSSQILRLKRAKPEYVLFHMLASMSASCLKDAKKFDFNPQFMATSVPFELTTVLQGGTATRGLIGTVHVSPWDSNAPGVVKMREITEKLSPGKGARRGNYLLGWAIAMTYAKGMEMAGRNLNSESLVEGIEKIKNFDTGDLTPPLSFGPNRHQGTYGVALYMPNVEQKTYFPITGWIEPKKN